MRRPHLLLLALCCAGSGCHLIFPFDQREAVVDADGPAADGGGEAWLDQTVDLAIADLATPELLPLADRSPAEAVLPAEAGPAPDGGGGIGASCGRGAACQAALVCVEGVCCDSPCGDLCMTCALPGKLGTCTPVPKSAGQVCSKQCQGASLETTYCDGAGTCGLASLKQCGTTLCDPVLLDCPPGCADHGGCIASSLCDRSAAHLNGHGVCVAPGTIAVSGTATYPNIDTAIAAVLASPTLKYVLLRAATNPTNSVSRIELTDPTDNLTIVGDGRPAISSYYNSNAGATVLVKAGSLTLQNVKVTHDATADGHGVICTGGTLTVVESEISGNAGIGARASQGCSFALRRSLVTNNGGGGLDLSSTGGGASAVVNNLIVNNGAGASTIGGARLLWTGVPVPTVHNNTVADNQAGAGTPAGINCPSSGGAMTVTGHNLIVWGNSPKGASSTCAFISSTVEGITSTAGGNSASDPLLDASASYTLLIGSPAVDTGATVPPTITVIDHAGKARKLGAATDMGAHER